MDDPVKIIYKFKNNNRRIQYHIYIFVGDIPSPILKVLESIKDKSLYESLTTLSQPEYKRLAAQYGKFWYKKIFNTYHINNTFQLVRRNEKQKQELVGIYGGLQITMSTFPFTFFF